MKDVTLGVSEALELINETLDVAFPFIIVEGEVGSFKVNQGKFVFFDIKDEASTLGCFMMLFKMNFPIADGMKIRVVAQPKITQWGKFSLTVHELMPVGEGSLQKAFDILKMKLETEGLFDAGRKRVLPKFPTRIGVISSSQAAGYRDFIKILENRWGGLEIYLADVTVQGVTAPEQIISAVMKLNEQSTPLDVIAIIRGGGSADDLATFNHEGVVRAVATSRTPTIAGIGHEVDTSLVDLAADVRAATPSNAAELLVPDKSVIISQSQTWVTSIRGELIKQIEQVEDQLTRNAEAIRSEITSLIENKGSVLDNFRHIIHQLNPELVLRRGYGIARKNQQVISSVTDVTIHERIELELSDGVIETEVLDVR